MNQQFDKSFQDYKSYRVIILENKIKAVLISDIKPDSNLNQNRSDFYSNEQIDEKLISAAALCVNIGNCNDPIECNGLAKFLQHMIFMGSAKYPTETDFNKYLNKHDGNFYAVTDFEHTVFSFDSKFENFENTLDIFANYFVAPLFLKDSIDQAIEAVQSDFEEIYYNDAFRIEGFLGSLSKSDSPYQKFHCGNRKSLKHDPEEKNIDIYKYLKEFWKNRYLSQWMTLAVQSRDTLDNLEAMVRSIFSKIPGNDTSKLDTSVFSEPFKTEEFPKFYYVVPIKDFKELRLTWSLPSVISNYRSKPLDVIGYFLKHKSDGSLMTYFTTEYYVVDLIAGTSLSSYNEASFNTLFSIVIHLTDKGFENITEIIHIVFSYIDILRKEGIPESLFEEYKHMRYTDFKYYDLEYEDPLDDVITLAINLQFYESHHVISGWDIFYEYNPELYSEMLSYFTVENLNVILLSKCNESSANKLNGGFGVKYSVRDFTDEERNRWNAPKIVQYLHFPEKNDFLAYNFDLIEIPDDFSETPADLAKSDYVELGKYGEIWYQLDKKFRTPEAIINFYMWSNKISENALNSCLADIVLHAVIMLLSIFDYDASIAGLKYVMKSCSSGILFRITGYTDNISVMFCTIIDFLKDFTLTEEEFFIYVEFMRKKYLLELSYSRKLYESISNKILYPEVWTVSERLKMLKDLSYKDVINFHKDMFHSMRIRSYFHGNMSKDQAKFCFMYCVENLNLQTTESKPKERVCQIPIGESRIRVLNLNPKSINTILYYTYSIWPATIELEAVNELLNYFLSSFCYKFLSEKEMIGVYARFELVSLRKNSRGNIGLTFVCFGSPYSKKFSDDNCISKMNISFETKALALVENLSDDDFNNLKSSFIADKLFQHYEMWYMEHLNFGEILSEEFIFDRNVRHVSAVENLKKSDLLEFFVERYLNKSVQRKLIVAVDTNKKLRFGHLDKSEEESLSDMDLIFFH